MRTGHRLEPSRAPVPPRAAPRAGAPAAGILRLQAAIGNRATRALMRAPATIEQEYAAERRRFSDRKREHQARVAQERAIRDLPPRVLREAGITAGTRVDGRTAGLVQAAIFESRLLRPYLEGKYPAATIPGPRFEVHDFDAQFDAAYRTLSDVRDNPASADVQNAALKARGFYHRRSNTIHLRPGSTFGHALHEAMHKHSVASFRGFYGGDLDEGVTQYLTDCLLREHGLAPATGHDYRAQLDCAGRLVRFTSFDLVARAYFVEHSALTRRLQEGLGSVNRWRTDLCAKLPA